MAKSKTKSPPKSKFKAWYSVPENRAKLNARRRKKYKTDPKYRKKVLLSTRDWRRDHAKTAKKVPPKPKTSFSIGDMATEIGCEQKTIRTLEAHGLIPKESDGRSHRRYTKKQIKLVRALVEFRKKTHYRDPDYREGLKTRSTAAFSNWS